MSSGIKVKVFNDFKTNVHPVGILFSIIITDAWNHEPEKYAGNCEYQ
jgi:hypothetical protein